MLSAGEVSSDILRFVERFYTFLRRTYISALVTGGFHHLH